MTEPLDVAGVAVVSPPTGDHAATGDAAGRGRRGTSAWLGLIGIAGLVVLMEFLPRAGLVPSAYLPPTSEVVGALVSELGVGATWTAIGDTLLGWGIGLAIAVSGGIVVGVLIGSSNFLRELTASTIEFLRPIPSVALIPLAVLMLGTGLQSKLLLVVYASFWQVLIQVLYGVHDVDPVAADTAHSYGFSRWARIRHVVWPTALPYVMTGVRLAAAVALVLAVTSELIIGNPGIGARLLLAQSGGAVAEMYALVVVTGVIGIAVNLLFRAVERRVLRWHPSVRGEEIA